MKAIFIHGFNGSKESRTGRLVKSVLQKEGVEVITETFDLLDVEGTLNKIDELVSRNSASLLIGTSLGGFYTLAYKGIINKIAINPCMSPSTEIPKLSEEEIPESTMLDFMDYENEIFTSSNNINTKGIFATNDEILGDVYYKEFKKFYGKENTYRFEGGHHGAAGAEDAIRSAFYDLGLSYEVSEDEFFKDFVDDDIKTPIFHRKRESVSLREHFVNLFPKNKPVESSLKKEIYNLFVKGYSAIGGMAGVSTIDDFFNEVDMIKINKRDGTIAAACAYGFDKGGRKLKFCTADKTHPKGKDALIQLMQDDIRRTERGFWGEVSGQPLHMYLRYANAPVINPEDIKKVLYNKEFLDFDKDNDLQNIDPKFRDEYKNAYIRKLGDGKYHPKVAIGYVPSEKVFESILTK
ncbi:MAG: hypothetical protein HUJ68_07430 [Clostridia bacterium]|nr:hypothetical protein [Clostridia bacterium]